MIVSDDFYDMTHDEIVEALSDRYNEFKAEADKAVAEYEADRRSHDKRQHMRFCSGCLLAIGCVCDDLGILLED